MWSRERLSVCTYFAILGAVCSAWASSLDELKVKLGLNDAQMGWLLFSAPCGNLISFLGTGPLVRRFSPGRVLRADSVMVFLGMTFALSVPFIPVEGMSALPLALAGYAVAGFGIAGMIPILYSRVNRTKAMPPVSVLTFVGAMGFLGYFAGPPLIGQMAEVTNLSLALGVFAVLIISLVFLRNDDRA